MAGRLILAHATCFVPRDRAGYAVFREFKYGMNLRNRRAHRQARATAWDFGNAKS
jgi:hypothetical protein